MTIAVYADDGASGERIRRALARPNEGCIVFLDDLALVHALCDGRLDGVRLLVLAADAYFDSVAITLGRMVRIATDRVGTVRVLDEAERSSLARAVTAAPAPMPPPDY